MATRKARVESFRPTKRHFASLLRLEREAGGAAALSRLLEVSPSALRRWKAGALTADAWTLVEHGREEMRRRRGEARDELRTFRELLEAGAGPDVPEKKRIKLGRTGNAPRGGPLTRGHRWTRGWNRMLSAELVGLFRAWASGVPKRFPLWQAVAGVAQHGPGDHRGYRTVMFQVQSSDGKPHPEAGEFTLDAQLPSRRSTSKQEVIDALAEILTGALADPRVKTFVKFTTLFNYRMRTAEERRQRESFLRRKRRTTWLKRKKRQRKIGAPTLSEPVRQTRSPIPPKAKKAKKVRKARSVRKTSSSRSASKRRTKRSSRSTPKISRRR